MSGINKVILVGRLGKDPETKYAASGSAVTNITLATSETWNDKQSGQKQEKTEWHRIVFFNRLAEVAGEFLKKGAQVYVEGKLQTRKWQDQNGQDRYTTEIVAGHMQMLDSKQTAEKPQGFRQPIANDIADRVANQMPHEMRSHVDYPADGHAAQQIDAAYSDFEDDDIPF